MRMVAVKTIRQPIYHPVKEYNNRRECDAFPKLLGIIGHDFLIDLNARLCAAIDTYLF